MKTILAIDDQHSNLVAITGLINNYLPDCKVLTAMSGKDGIEKAKDEKIDVILLDVIMPEIDGFETCKSLKNDPLTKNIPVIMITAIKTDIQSRIEGLNIGADAFLSKPIDSSEFIAQVNVMLRIKKAEDKLRAEKEDANENLNIRTQELVESENLLQTIFDDPNNFIGILEVDGSFIRANRAALTFIDSANSKLKGVKFWETPWWTHSEELQKKLKSGINLAKQGEIIRFEANHINKNGKPLFVNFSIRPVRDSQKNIFRLIVEGNDITKRKRAEQIQKVLLNITNAVTATNNVEKLIYLIKDELGTLIDTKNYYIALYDEETDSLTLPFMADEKDKGIESFPAGKTMTGYVIKTKKSLLATAAQQEELVKKGKIKFVGSRSKIWLGVPLFLNTKVIGVVAVQSYTDENAYNKSDMEILEFISDQISISIDRTKSEQDLVLALEKATESDRLKSSFLATMSHELRTPLNSIIGFSDFITEELTVEEIINFVKTINESGHHLLSIVEDILDITLIESGEIKIADENTHLQSVLTEVHEYIKVEQQKAKKNILDLNLSIPSENKDLIINTDPSKLKQILINILKNALKFTSEGHIQYGFSLKKDIKPMLKFYIKDTGIGIPKEKHDFIFNVFRQVEDSHTRNFGGAGVGLAISKKLIEFLGGKIWLESEEGIGSIFYFTIPYKEAELDENKNELKISHSSEEKIIEIKKKTILIVEDDESSYKYLKLVIEKLGYITHWADNGEVAVEFCKTHKDIDLVLMDINMPVMNGYKATKEIKKLFPNLPIIAQTAYAMGGDIDKILEAGCADYISKPIKRSELYDLIEKYLKE